MVQAYKGLLKEKEALEASFKALTVLKPEQATRLDNAGSSETNETHEAEAVESNYEPNEKNEVRVSYVYILFLFNCGNILMFCFYFLPHL